MTAPELMALLSQLPRDAIVEAPDGINVTVGQQAPYNMLRAFTFEEPLGYNAEAQTVAGVADASVEYVLGPSGRVMYGSEAQALGVYEALDTLYPEEP